MRFVCVLFLALILSSAATGQRFVTTITVSVTPMSGDEYDARLVAEVKTELRKLRYIGIVEHNADVVVVLMAAPIEGLNCTGYVARMDAGGGRDKKSDTSSMHTAADMPTLAKHLVDKLKREFFEKGK